MQTIVLTDALAGLALRGRSQFSVSLPVDAAISLADGDDFMVMCDQERPVTSRHLVDAVVAEYARLIANGSHDAESGPVVTASELYRVDGEMQLLRPTGKEAKGKTVEKLPCVVVQSRERFRAMLPEGVRGLVSIDVPREWRNAADKRAQDALPPADAAPVAQNALTDGQVSRLVIEPKLAAREPFPAVETLETAETGS